MTSEPDPHAPTSAGPEPTPVVDPAEATWRVPPGSAAPGGAPDAPRPELVVGGAFAGGFLAAMILKRLGR